MVTSKQFCRLLPVLQNILLKRKIINSLNSDCKVRSTFFFPFTIVVGNKNRLTFQDGRADLYSGVRLKSCAFRGLEQLSHVFCTAKQWLGYLMAAAGMTECFRIRLVVFRFGILLNHLRSWPKTQP